MDNTSQTNRKPTHRVITALPRGKDKDPFYQRIGAGWESEKGTIWLSFELLPTDQGSSIGIRPITEADKE